MALRTDGDAYIAVHADTGPYARELGPQTEAASAAAGRRSGRRFATEFNVSLLGRLRGSRNDFLNAVGVIGGAIERLGSGAITGGLNTLGQAIRNVAGDFNLLGGTAARNVGSVLDRVGKSIQGLGAGGIDGLIVQVVALVASFQAAVGVAGIFAAGLSLLTGAATALAVSLGGALLGGLALLGPLIASLVVGAGALAVAFSDLSDEQKAVFGPLNDLFNTLRDAAQESLFGNIGNQVQGLVNILSPLRGVLVGVAGAASEWLDSFIAAFDPSGPLGGSLSTLGEAIPGLFRGLLDLLTNVSTALTGLFAQASPFAQQFLDRLNALVLQFSNWLNQSGDQRFANFLNTALGLLDQVWGIATQLGTTLQFLFDAGAASGGQFLQMIQDILADFNAWLGTEEGRDALSRWFADSVTAVQRVGEVLGALIRLFDELDNQNTRLAFALILTALAQIVGAITSVQRFFNEMTGAVGAGSRTINQNIAVVGIFIDNLVANFNNLLAGARNAVGQIGQFFASLPGAISGAVGNLGSLLFQAGVNVINGLRNGIASAANSLLAYIANLASRIASAFKNALGIRSPSRVFTEFGRNISEGLALGITESSGLVGAAMSGLTGNLNTPISSLGGGGNTSVSNSGGMTIAEGAIVVNSPFADPRLTAISVMDALAVRGK